MQGGAAPALDVRGRAGDLLRTLDPRQRVAGDERERWDVVGRCYTPANHSSLPPTSWYRASYTTHVTRQLSRINYLLAIV